LATGVIARKIAFTFLGSMIPGFFCGIIPKLFVLVDKLSNEPEVKNKEILTSVQGLQYDVFCMRKEMEKNTIEMQRQRMRHQAELERAKRAR